MGGHLKKAEVRELAAHFELHNKNRKDSQGICFLGKLKFSDFVRHYLGTNPGSIVDIRTGACLGKHQGLWFHTIGQRKGLGPFLDHKVHQGPWYVASKDVDSNTLYVTNDYADV